MFGKILKHYREEGIQKVIEVAMNFFREFMTPFCMRTIERVVKPKRKIVFCNFAGKGYGGYPRSICDELINRKEEIDLVWLVKDNSEIFPYQVRKVKINSYKALWELSTALIWIDNCRKSRKIRKSKKQFYLQMWHGGGPCLKMIEGDALPYLSKTYVKDAINDTKMADLFISDCKWQDDNYRNAFWYKGEILKCTTPPNDFFYQNWNDVKAEVYDYFHIRSDKRILLYAPTFRNNHSINCYDIDYDRIIEVCKKKFGGDWNFIIRIHPTMSEMQKFIHYSDSVINGTAYPQIENLLIASEILITDFSASMFLAYRWKITTFLYANDYEEYIQNERPLYFKLDELPASFSTSNDQLEQAIMEYSNEEYSIRCDELSYEVGFYEGGRSVKTITDRIEDELNNRR